MRDVLNRTSPRRMAVLRPLRVVAHQLSGGPDGGDRDRQQPRGPAAGTRKVPFSRELWIERDDFMEDPPKKFFRLSPGREVRLRAAYFITCQEVVKDASGQVVELRCTYDPATRGGSAPDGRSPKATLHWLSARARPARGGAPLRPPVHAARSRGGGRPPRRPEPEVGGGDPARPGWSPAWSALAPGARVQFERLGYFCVDPDSGPGRLVFNRTVTLRDTWAKVKAKG